jgi:hypothetical protein
MQKKGALPISFLWSMGWSGAPSSTSVSGDASVCGQKNERSFRKMRNLLVAYYDSIGKAVDRIGPEETKKIIEVITERKKKLRDSGGR